MSEAEVVPEGEEVNEEPQKAVSEAGGIIFIDFYYSRLTFIFKMNKEKMQKQMVK